MLKSVKLENFKCYRKQEVVFAPLTIFCGNNSVGKSTVIQAFAIPFQSKFQDFAQINGSLVTLGTFQDICSRSAVEIDKDDHLNVKLDFCIAQRNIVVSYGYENFDQQVMLGNKLALVVDSSDRQSILNYYFSLNGFQFLEAERFGPRNNFALREDADIVDWIGSKGEYAVELIYRLLNQLNKDRRDLAGGIDDPRLHTNLKNVSIVKNIEFWMSEISPGFQISPSLIEEAGISHSTYSTWDSATQTKPINMGFGLSYALGIVTALLVTKPGGLVVIENPEAHLHPRGQSYLGRLIALSALAGGQVIIETHSDHLLNGIRVIARLNPNYQNDFKVLFASSKVDSSELTEITIGNKGELSNWPEGFFDQQAFDIKTLMKGEEIRSKKGGI